MSSKAQFWKAAIGATVSILISGCAAVATPVVNNQGSPLQDFIGSSIWSNGEELRQLQTEINSRREDLIAQCMLDFGFTYIPDPNSGRWAIGSIAFDHREPDDRDWVMEYGFGIVSGHWNTSLSDSVRDGEDPNHVYTSNLTDNELAAFQYALNGPADFSPSPNMTQSDWAEFGEIEGAGDNLSNKHGKKVRSNRENDEFAPLFEAINEMWESAANNPLVSLIDQEWVNCMADKGHLNLEHPSDASSRLQDEYRASELWGDGGDQIALRGLQAREIEIALADLDCREAIDYRSRRETILFAAEAQFVVDHRLALEAYRSAAEQRN